MFVTILHHFFRTPSLSTPEFSIAEEPLVSGFRKAKSTKEIPKLAISSEDGGAAGDMEITKGKVFLSKSHLARVIHLLLSSLHLAQNLCAT